MVWKTLPPPHWRHYWLYLVSILLLTGWGNQPQPYAVVEIIRWMRMTDTPLAVHGLSTLSLRIATHCKYTINPLKNKPMKKKSLGCTFPECFKQEVDVRHIVTITIAKTKCDAFPKRFVWFWDLLTQNEMCFLDDFKYDLNSIKRELN